MSILKSRFAIVVLSLVIAAVGRLWAADAPASEKVEYVGAETCLNCHADQASFKDSHHGRALPQAKGIEFSRTCETCHGPGSLHAAAAGDKSNPGFATIKVLKKLAASELNQTCLECHQDAARMHWVGSAHERRNVSCAQCHSIHNPAESKASLVKPTQDQLCAQCHQAIASKVRRSEHMPLSEGKMSCGSCHNPHGTATPKMLAGQSVNDNCYGCHADKRGPFLWEHLPVRENCTNCHDAHGSHHPKMLQAKQPFLCQRCHVQAQHRSTAYDQSSINTRDNKVIFHSCANCHSNIHGSNHPSGKFFTR